MKLLCISQPLPESDGVLRLPKVLSYTLEEPATKAGKRKLDQEVGKTVARITGSCK